MSKSIQKVDQRLIKLEEIKSFSLIGDPGCDGLGAEIISTFSRALEASSGDFIIILGDLVPYGSQNFYENTVELIENTINKPVYMLCGNHDTHFYHDYFGLKDYTLVDNKTLIIILDNSRRTFTQSTLEFLEWALKEYPRENILLLMHIPPPNQFTNNSVRAEEWKKVVNLIKKYNLEKNIKYIICGHLHSYFEDSVDGFNLIVSGGGGARIEEIQNIKAPYHHIINFSYSNDDTMTYHKTDLVLKKLVYKDEDILEKLKNSFTNECMAHVRYKLYAEDASKRGLFNLAKLFRAASDSEYYHARNYYYAMSELKETLDTLNESIENENYEISQMYKDYLNYAKTKNLAVPAYAFTDSIEAEKIHHKLFVKAAQYLRSEKDIPESDYYTCTSCGYTFESNIYPKSCPVCGAPKDKIIPVQ